MFALVCICDGGMCIVIESVFKLELSLAAREKERYPLVPKNVAEHEEAMTWDSSLASLRHRLGSVRRIA